MSDCPNVEVRELLPDLLHETLAGSVRAQVEEHIRACSDCAAELELLLIVRSLERDRRVPAMDTPSIVAALPRVRPQVQLVPVATRPLWRLAAAVTFVALGGLSLAVVQRYFGNPTGADTVVAVSSPVSRPESVSTPPLVLESAGDGRRPVNLTGGGGVADLTDADLEQLIGALDGIEAAPHADPDSRAISRFVSGSTGGD